MPRKKTIKKSSLMPTVLISGGAGFVGSYLAEAFLKNKARVVVLDNYRSGKEIHVNHLLSNPNFALFDADINVGIPEDIESVDYIVHLAGLEEYLFSKTHITLNTLLTNSFGTKNLLDLAKKSQAKFLLASTIDVYEGMISQLDINEYFGKTSMDEQKYSLVEAKRYSEALVWEYFKNLGVDARIARLPEIYGPRMDLESSGSLGKFITNVLEGNDILIKGEGAEKEYYLYIDDAISGIVKTLLSSFSKGKIYSLVNPSPSSVLELAFLVKSLADQPLEIKFTPADDSFKFSPGKPDTFNLKDLKWEPKVSLKDGVKKILKEKGYSVNENNLKQNKYIQNRELNKKPVVSETMGSLIAATPQISSLAETAPIVNSTLVSPQPAFPSEIKKTIFDKLLARTEKSPQLYVKAVPTMPKLKFLSNIHFKRPSIRFSFRFGNFAPSVFVAFLSFIFVFILFPALNLFLNAKSGFEKLQSLQNVATVIDMPGSMKTVKAAAEDFYSAKKSLRSLRWIFYVSGSKDAYYNLSYLLSSVENFSYGVEQALIATSPYLDLWKNIKPNTEVPINLDLIKSSDLTLKKSEEYIQLAYADFSKVNSSKIPNFASDSVIKYKNVITTALETLPKLNTVSNDLYALLGFQDEKNYLLLFQNNNEIRPTGGFIGSYAKFSMKDGKLTDVQIDDIYNPDGQMDLRNIAEPAPKPIVDFLVEDKLYIRNANWDPSFPKSAEQIKELFYKVDGIKFDGVFAIDLNFAKNLLDATGPVYLASFDETISSENLYERAQFHSSFNYETGSQQKKQFMTVLGSKMIETLFSLDSERLAKIPQVMYDSVQERHFYAYLFNSRLSNLLEEYFVDGSLIKTGGDYLYVVNANLGGTKSNYFVKNELVYKVSSKTRDGLLRGELILKYDHTGKDEAWPGGPYTDYLRVLTQKGSKLTGAKIKYSNGSEEDIFNKMILDNIDGYNSFETSFVLIPNSQLEVVLTYDLPIGLSITKEQKDYSLIWQKQPGTQDDKYMFEISSPFGMQAVSYFGLEKKDAILISEGLINKDLKISASFE